MKNSTRMPTDLPSVFRTGYDLSGWSPPVPEIMPAEDVTFTATWTPHDYSITYNLDGGTVEGVNPASYNIETAEFTLTNPTRTGYFFAGWTGTDIDPSEPAMEVTVPTGSVGDRHYTATWTGDPDYRTLTFDGSGGTLDGSGGQVTVSLRLKPGDEIIPPAVTRELYIFDGWLVDDGSGNLIEYEVGVMPDYDLTLYADWRAVKNFIKLDMNGVNSYWAPGVLHCWTDYPDMLPNTVYNVDGSLALAGWNTASDGTGRGPMQEETVSTP